MKSLFKVNAVDREFYEKRLRDWLPDKIIDIHTHVWLARHQVAYRRHMSRVQTWPARVAKESPIEELLETYRLMFPGKKVTPLIFGSALSLDDDLNDGNKYVSDCAAAHHLPALIWSAPEWSGEDLERKIKDGGFLGAKCYLSFAPSYLSEAEIRIFDYFPHHQLEVLNKNGWVMMLHIPRNDRLRDPVNLAQMLEIEKRYPDIKLIIAHVGRAYCPEDIGDAFKVLSKTRKMCFDISANTNAVAFRRLLEAVGPKRVLFGSDLPILRMRTRRICENGKYINLVPKGMYGDVSADSHMREVNAAEAARLTFFMYEELDAFRRAAHAAKLNANDVGDVFYNNARQLLEKR
ncbi:MAG: amidohydrolase [Verrucomicrobia bacterium]|nr:amidohydrolase [Verrucomicrobiota bacterium]MBU1735399.1 amidohydrolase [Verrucomicrobiota bacterium]MBU1857446.1 amidohydrolase [Verrucomicrobiota bacterium]